MFKRYLPFVLVIAVAMAVQLWVALHWRAQFTSDESVRCLMSKHISEGKPIPITHYNIHHDECSLLEIRSAPGNYTGSLLEILSAPLMRLMGYSVMSLRTTNLLFLGAFFVLHAVLVHRLWGRWVALISLGILASPSYALLSYIARGYFATWAALGAAALVLSQTWFPRKPELNYIRLFLLGALLGIGLWTYPGILVHIFTIALIFWLSSPEWSGLHKKMAFLKKLMPIVMVCLIASSAIAVLTANERIQQQIIMCILFLAGGLLCLTALIESTRRKVLASNILIAISGFIIGYSPMLYKWLFLGVAPEMKVEHIFPRLGSFVVILKTAFLPFWGIPLSSERIPFPRVIVTRNIMPDPSLLQVLIWALMILAAAVAVAAFAAFIWNEREILWSLIRLSPISERHRKTLMCMFFIAIPVVSLICRENTPYRYLLIAWPVTSIMIAVFVSRLMGKSRILGFIAAGLLVFQLGVNFAIAKNRLKKPNPAWLPENIAKLEEFLAENNLQGGYVTKPMGYALNFLTEERFTFAAFRSWETVGYLPYRKKVKAFPAHAFVLHHGWEWIRQDAATVNDFIQGLKRQKHRPPCFCFPQVLEHLKKQVVLKRERVSVWDVWVVGNKRGNFRNHSKKNVHEANADKIRTIDFKDCAVPVDQWREGQLWPEW